MLYVMSYLFNEENIRRSPKRKRCTCCREHFQYAYWLMAITITALCRLQMHWAMKVEVHSVLVEVVVFALSCTVLVHGNVITNNPIPCLPIPDLLCVMIAYLIPIAVLGFYVAKYDFSENTDIYWV